MLHLSFVMVTSMNFFLTRTSRQNAVLQSTNKTNKTCPRSLSNGGKLKLGTKSDIVRCLEDAIEEQDDITPSVEVVVLDGPAIVHMLKPAAARTFREYAQDVFLPSVLLASAG